MRNFVYHSTWVNIICQAMHLQTFELTLIDTTRTTRLTVLLLLGVFTLAGISIWAALQIDNKALLLLVLVALLGGGGYLGWRAYKQAALVPALLTITPARLQIEDLRPEPRLSQTLRLADIITYRYSSYNNTEELRLNLPDAPPLKLRSAGALAKSGDFRGMLAAFEQAMNEAPSPTGVATRRERSFFEKPVSTYLLVVFTVVIGIVGVAIFTSHRPLQGNLLGVIGTYVAYVVAWRAAAPRRNAPSETS